MIILSGLIGVAGLTLATGAVAEEVKKPNIVFIEVDDMLYRFMGKHGDKFVKTPNIDKLAAGGVYFKNAVCQGLMCGPSRNTLITGLYPHNLGFYQNGQMRTLPEGIWSFPQALQRVGYQTSWIGKCHVHPPKDNKKNGKQSASEGLKAYMGFDCAVASLGRAMLSGRARTGKKIDGDVYFEHLKKHKLLELFIADSKSRKSVTSLPEKHYLDGFYANHASEWLETKKNSKDPLFLWVNYSCPHGPYDVPQKYHDMYKNKKIPPPKTTLFAEKMPKSFLTGTKPVRSNKLDEQRRGNAAATTFVDAMVGEIIDKLKATGKYENTVIFFFSDHGVFMGNHGLIHKGTPLNEVTNPSLIIHYPKKFQQGIVDSSPVELLSIVKTVMDIAEVSAKDKSKPFGESLLPLLMGESGYNTRYVFSENEGVKLCFDGRYRYYANKDKAFLFDFKLDPIEMKNIAKYSPEIVVKMQKAVDDWLKKTAPVLPANHLKNKDNLKNWTCN